MTPIDGSLAGRRLEVADIPPLTAGEEAAAIDGYCRELRRELIVDGEPLANIDSIIAEMKGRVVARPTGSGVPTVQYQSTVRAGLLSVSAAAAELVRTIADRATLDATGPDPVPMLAERLRLLGLPADEAAALARGRVRRLLPDGRIVAVTANGATLFESKLSDTPSESELAAARNPRAALAAACRAILAERENPPTALPSARTDVSRAF